jgi:hypothetical protein
MERFRHDGRPRCQEARRRRASHMDFQVKFLLYRCSFAIFFLIISTGIYHKLLIRIIFRNEQRRHRWEDPYNLYEVHAEEARPANQRGLVAMVQPHAGNVTVALITYLYGGSCSDAPLSLCCLLDAGWWMDRGV